MQENNKQELQEIEEMQEQPKITKKQKKHLFDAAIALSLAFVLLIGSSFAYFTDRASLSTTGTAGTVSIALDSDINLLDEDGRDILNPGDIRSGSFTVTNMGNKSADIRTTIALTAYDRNGDPIDLEGSATTQSMYDLYLASDVEYIDGRGNIPKSGAQPLQLKTVNGNVITYSIPEYSLNGNGDKWDEVETISDINNYAVMPLADLNSDLLGGVYETDVEYETIPGVTPSPEYKKDCDFVLVFNTAAGNEFQGSVVQIDVIVEAKQHENTTAGWQLCEHENVTVGALSQGVVLPENVITTNGTINPGYEYTPSTSGNTSSCSLQGQIVGEAVGFKMGVSAPDGTYYDCTSDENGIFAIENLLPNTEYTLTIPRNNSRPTEYSFTTGAAGTITQLTLTVTNQDE